MCQLIFSNTNHILLNRLLVLHLSRHDSDYQNKDGWGMFSERCGIKKTEKTANTLINLGEILTENIIDERPILAHVRAASKGIPVVVENVHPFQTKDFVLAHNGTLYRKDEKVGVWDADESRTSDSLMFLQELQKAYASEKDIPKALNNAMSLFKGKFAFLIYSKVEKAFFAARGKTADLHIAHIKNEKEEIIGYALNTQKYSLEKALIDVSLNYQVVYGERIFWDIENLPDESVFFCAADGVVKLGEIKEVSSYLPNFTQSTLEVIHGRVLEAKAATHFVKRQSTAITQFEKDVSKILSISEDNVLDIYDIERIAYIIFGKVLGELSEEDVHELATKVFPRFIPSGKLLKQLKRKNIRGIPLEFFNENDIQYPIGLNRENAGLLISKLEKFLEKKKGV